MTWGGKREGAGRPKGQSVKSQQRETRRVFENWMWWNNVLKFYAKSKGLI